LKSEELSKLGLGTQELLSETPMESLKIVLDYLKKREEDYEVQSWRRKEVYQPLSRKQMIIKKLQEKQEENLDPYENYELFQQIDDSEEDS